MPLRKIRRKRHRVCGVRVFNQYGVRRHCESQNAKGQKAPQRDNNCKAGVIRTFLTAGVSWPEAMIGHGEIPWVVAAPLKRHDRLSPSISRECHSGFAPLRSLEGVLSEVSPSCLVVCGKGVGVSFPGVRFDVGCPASLPGVGVPSFWLASPAKLAVERAIIDSISGILIGSSCLL